MKGFSKNTGRAYSMPKGLTVGVAVSVCLTLMLGALLAFLVSREVVRQERIGYWIMPILFIASGMGSLLSYRKIRRRRLLVFSLTAAFYLASLLFMTMLFFSGRFEGVLPTALLIFGGSGTVCFLSATVKQKQKPSMMVRRFR